MAKVFDRSRAQSIYEKIYMLYGFQTLALWGLVGAAIHYADGRSLYWLASIFASLTILGMAGFSFYLYRTVIDVDHNLDTQQIFFNKLTFRDIFSVVTAIVCMAAAGLAGWLGFTYGHNPLESTDFVGEELKMNILLSKHVAAAAADAKIGLIKLTLRDIFSVVTALVCMAAAGLAGWLGFTYGHNPLESTDFVGEELKTVKQLRAEAKIKDTNGKITAGILALHAMVVFMAGMCIWADWKFRQYLLDQRKRVYGMEETQGMREGAK